MKMTKDQATAYCKNKAMSSLDSSTSGFEKSLLWNQLRKDIEEKGLQETEETCVQWRDTQMEPLHHGIAVVPDPHESMTWTLYGTFLDALYDDEEIERAIAGDLLWKVKEEIDRREEWPLRTYYLSCFRDHLNAVLNGSTNLGAYEEVREGIEEKLRRIEGEYGAWIDEALKNQQE